MDYDIFVPRYSEYSEAVFEEFQFAAQSAINVAHRLLRDPRITPHQIVGLAHALYALQRFPIATPGVHVEFGVCIDGKDRLEYIDYRITEDCFEISRGGHTQGDHYPLPGAYIGSSGYHKNVDPYFIDENERILAAWLNNDYTEIRVHSDSYIEGFVETEIEQNPFNYHPLNQKAKHLLQKKPNYKRLTAELYIYQLMHFGLQSMDEAMRQKRQEIREQHLMQHLEDKVKKLRWDMEPAEVMSWLLQNKELSDLLETEGANTAMWIVINQILIDLSEHIQETYLTPSSQLALFDTNP